MNKTDSQFIKFTTGVGHYTLKNKNIPYYYTNKKPPVQLKIILACYFTPVYL